MPRNTRAGSRVNKFRPGMGRIASNKIAWLRTYITGQMAILELDPEEFDEENNVETNSEPGKSFLLVIPFRNNAKIKPLIWNVCSMTHEELEATREFFNHLFDLADPIIRERDKVAQDAFAAGDDSFGRVYRSLPQLVKRERQVSKHDQGVHNRPASSADGSGHGLDPDGGLRGSGQQLADGESQEDSTEDYD